jgi:hypothetical protein|tara:strand:- start:330 stop:497 length:168 start_codon:yes stop_codon:yes gene_type:complete
MKQEIRRNDDGTIDEVVGEGHYHLEQMNDNEWCLILGETVIHLTSDKEIALVEVE